MKQGMSPAEVAESISRTKRKQRLEYHERNIERAHDNLVAVFCELANDPLKPWLDVYDTFEQYCIDRWNMTPRRIQQLRASEGTKMLLLQDEHDPAMVDAINSLNEGQTRALESVQPERRKEVFKKALKNRTRRKVSAKDIKAAAASIVTPSTVINTPEPDLGDEEPAFDPGPVCEKCGQPLPPP